MLGEGILRLEVNNGNTLLQLDKDGGADSFVTLATLQGVTNVTLADLIFPQGNYRVSLGGALVSPRRAALSPSCPGPRVRASTS